MESKKNFRIGIIFAFGILLPLIEIYRSNHFILFDYEKAEYFVFSLVYLIFFGLIFVGLYFRINSYKFATLFFIATSFYFIYYQKIAALFYDIIRINYSGILFWFISLILILLIIKKYNNFLYEFTKALIIVQLSLTIFSILSINKTNTEVEITNIELQTKPDIYFFLIDNLASQDNLYSEFNLDYIFTEEISKSNNKFHLNSKSLSSHGRTMESISSMMEMDYKLKGQLNTPENVWKEINKGYLSQETLLENIFIENNYKIYKYGIAFPCIDTKNTHCYKKYYSGLKSVSSLILENTPLNVINNIMKNREIYILDFLFNIDCKTYYCGDPNLSSFFVPRQAQPSLHLIHLMNSHGPFFVDSTCNKYEEIIPYTDMKTNLEQYEDSINCLLVQMKEFIDLSKPDDIIFFQSDHGPLDGKIPNNLDNLSDESFTKLKLRYETLSISNINEQCQGINNSLGGVNTFSFVINCLSNKTTFNTDSRAFLVDENSNYSVNELTKILGK